MKRTYKQLAIDMRKIGFREAGDHEVYTIQIVLNNCRESQYFFIEMEDAILGANE